MELPLPARVLHWIERLLLGVPRDAANESGLPRGWVGPRMETLLDVPPEARHLLISGQHHPHGEPHRVVRVCVRVEDRLVGRLTLERPGRFCDSLPLPEGLLSPVRVVIESEPSFVPDDFLHNGDVRRLCFHLDTLAPFA